MKTGKEKVKFMVVLLVSGSSTQLGNVLSCDKSGAITTDKTGSNLIYHVSSGRADRILWKELDETDIVGDFFKIGEIGYFADESGKVFSQRDNL